jgi:hypothetical protein
MMETQNEPNKLRTTGSTLLENANVFETSAITPSPALQRYLLPSPRSIPRVIPLARKAMISRSSTSFSNYLAASLLEILFYPRSFLTKSCKTLCSMRCIVSEIDREIT